MLMETKGIRIFEKKNNIVKIKIQDILSSINNGSSLFWSVLYIYGSGSLKDGWSTLREGKTITAFEEKINKLETGLILNWDELLSLMNSYLQVWGVLIIGCKDFKSLHRYQSDQEMYESCDIVIELVDSYFWEVFSRESKLIIDLSEKFKFLKQESLLSNYKR